MAVFFLEQMSPTAKQRPKRLVGMSTTSLQARDDILL